MDRIDLFRVLARVVDLVEESVDCVVRVGVLSDATLVARPIAKLPLLNLASPTHLARYGTPLAPADLERHLAVDYASPSSGRLEEWEWAEGAELRTLRMRSRVAVNNAEAYIACYLASLWADPGPGLRRGTLSGDRRAGVRDAGPPRATDADDPALSAPPVSVAPAPCVHRVAGRRAEAGGAIRRGTLHHEPIGR